MEINVKSWFCRLLIPLEIFVWYAGSDHLCNMSHEQLFADLSINVSIYKINNTCLFLSDSCKCKQLIDQIIYQGAD